MVKSGIELITIQKRNKLNQVFATGNIHEVNKGVHRYTIFYGNRMADMIKPFNDETHIVINFQNGPRNVEGSIHGVVDGDLLEIVKHRMESFQSGPYATDENAEVIKHITLALMYMNKRAEDRFEANKLGTNKI